MKLTWRRAVDVPDIDHFDLTATMDSGQLFRWRRAELDDEAATAGTGAHSGDEAAGREPARLAGEAYVGVVGGYVWRACRSGRRFWCDVGTGESGTVYAGAGDTDLYGPADPDATGDERLEAVRRYFDLDTDYAAISRRLYRSDPALRPALDRRAGLRLIRQDAWETLVTFILSSNNNMPRIRLLVDRLAEAFGAPIGGGFYRFPLPSELAEAGEAAFRELGAGYRAPYVLEAARRVHSGELDLDRLYELPTDAARAELMSLPGVGRKVADCVLLFGLDKRDVFPLDVWAKRAVETVYFGGEQKKLDELQAFVSERFGDDAGHAQNYLFNDVRLRRVEGLGKARTKARAKARAEAQTAAPTEGGSGRAHEAPSRGRRENAKVASVRRR